jgi:hypothetical protein
VGGFAGEAAFATPGPTMSADDVCFGWSVVRVFGIVISVITLDTLYSLTVAWAASMELTAFLVL